MYLLTYHGLLLGLDTSTSTLIQVPVMEVSTARSPVDVVLPGVGQVRADYGSFLANTPDVLTTTVDVGPLSAVTATISRTGRTVTLSDDSGFLSAVPPDRGGRIKVGVSQANEWETFVLLSEIDLEDLRFILSNDWVVDEGRDVVRGRDLALGAGFVLKIGPYQADLRFQFPLDRTHFPFRVVVLQEGWRIEKIYLFRPLIYVTAFKSPQVLSQAYLCINSLAGFGRYDGDLLFITDQDKHTILENISCDFRDRIIVHNTYPADWVGYVASKYCILEWERAEYYQPIMFSDPDVVFDADVTGMLASTAASDRIAAPLEDISALGSSPSVGASLIQRDGRDTRYSRGFNAGTLGIPNMRAHREMLLLIRQLIVNHASLHGRSYHDWVDQETANYVSYRLGHFDTHRLTPFVRYGWSGVEKDARGRKGLVHFWPPRRTSEKLAAMTTYFGAVQALLRGEVN